MKIKKKGINKRTLILVEDVLRHYFEPIMEKEELFKRTKHKYSKEEIIKTINYLSSVGSIRIRGNEIIWKY